jgi:hypothetical protein
MAHTVEYYVTTFSLLSCHAENLCRIEARVEKLWEGNLSDTVGQGPRRRGTYEHGESLSCGYVQQMWYGPLQAR